MLEIIAFSIFKTLAGASLLAGLMWLRASGRCPLLARPRRCSNRRPLCPPRRR